MQERWGLSAKKHSVRIEIPCRSSTEKNDDLLKEIELNFSLGTSESEDDERYLLFNR